MVVQRAERVVAGIAHISLFSRALEHSEAFFLAVVQKWHGNCKSIARNEQKLPDAVNAELTQVNAEIAR